VYKPSRIIEKSVNRGDLGVKSGRGFYKYSEDDAENFRSRTNQAIIKIRKAMEGL